MSQSRGNIARLAAAMGLGLLLSGCGVVARRPWMQVAEEATGDGLSPDTAVRFSPAPRDLIVFVRSEQAWLELHGYTRINGQQVKSALAPTRRGFLFLHAWPVRESTGQACTIYFDETPMVGSPMQYRGQSALLKVNSGPVSAFFTDGPGSPLLSLAY